MLENSKQAAVFAQQIYADEKHIPWGISECAFAKVEESGAYGYRAFGVPQLALQQDEERLVVAPYATMLALPIDPAEAIRNLRWMAKKGWFGTYGLLRGGGLHARCAALPAPALCAGALLDGAPPGHEPAGDRQSSDNSVVQQWFRRDARVQATELLLQERPVGHVARKPSRKRPAPKRKSFMRAA